MKRLFYKLLLLIFVFSLKLGSAFASVIIVPSDGEVKIPIDRETGSLLQLPSSVKTITPSKSFQISDVASDVDAVTGTKMDVRLFQVRPVPGAHSDNVTFVLGNGRIVKTQLIPSESAEKHYELVFPNDSKKVKHTKFLQSEISLMAAMIRDEGGDFAREVKDSSVSISGFESASAKLVRIFAGNGLSGYAFELRNKSSEVLNIDVSRLSIGNENASAEKAILLHSEKEKLEPCGLISKPECKTRIFVVARGDVSNGGFGLRKRVSANGELSKAPFVRTNEDLGGGAQ
jgi:hypothetical protein